MKKVLDEKYLVTEVLSGNRNAFIQLIRQYEGLVLHIVTPLIGVNEDREDICQNVFIKVYEKLNTFQFKSKLATWIGNIAYNCSINYLQKKKNILLSSIVASENEISFLDSLNFESDNPEQIIIRREDIKQLSEAINMLPEFQKTVLFLFYKEEISLIEISEILQMTVNTVKSHLFRAKKSLKQLMTKNEAK
jgi:RNA polymerase sigma factor (sigma-70 family)